MKVKDLVEIQEEYKRRDDLIVAIEEILKRLVEPKDGLGRQASNIFGGLYIHVSVSLPRIEIPSPIGDLIRDDLVDLLQRHLVELKCKQDALEI